MIAMGDWEEQQTGCRRQCLRMIPWAIWKLILRNTGFYQVSQWSRKSSACLWCFWNTRNVSALEHRGAEAERRYEKKKNWLRGKQLKSHAPSCQSKINAQVMLNTDCLWKIWWLRARVLEPDKSAGESCLKNLISNSVIFYTLFNLSKP